mmetsp:Transcript_3755/g.5509  ORF Transcript_3755/g.5509 Transcript_3755/m.5509 type:complete len:322 (-) Transcript_3755:165-1130(-)
MMMHSPVRLMSILLVSALLLEAVSPLAFQLPKFPNFFGGGASSSSSSSPANDGSSALRPGDSVLIIGGTGGVGQLVTKKLQSRSEEGTYNVRVSSRDVARGKETIDDDGVDVVRLDLVGENKSSDEELQAALEGVNAVVISVGTTAFPTKKWSGGNTPKAIDEEAVVRLANAAAASESVRRVTLLTSVGVDRTGEMPFLILNLFGVLDAKRAGEEAVKKAGSATEGGFDYAIVRPGRLVGGPYTNLDVAKLLQIEGGAENGVTVESGDTLLGDCKRDACAEAVVQCLERAECVNTEFSIISNEEAALTDAQWTDVFVGMRV